MYLHEARCAHCGGKFDDTYKADTFNAVLDKYRTAPDERQWPYFCAPSCADDAVDRKGVKARVDTAYNIEIARTERIARDINTEDMYHDEIQHHAKVLYEEQKAAARKRDADFQTELDAARKRFFARYADEIQKLIEAENEQDIELQPFLKTKYLLDIPQVVVPALYEPSLRNAMIAMRSVVRKGHYYSDDPGQDFAALVKLCTQQLGKLTQASRIKDALPIAEVSALDAAADKLALIRKAYSIFQSTARGHETITRRNLRQIVKGARDMTDDELWKRVDKSCPVNVLIEDLYKGSIGPDFFLQRQAPVELTDWHRFFHTHILGGTGSGKTTLMQRDIINDLRRENPPGMIIVEPKGMMCDRIRALDVFHPDHGRLRDRLIVLDATDLEAPPALNMFSAVAAGVTSKVKNQIEAQTIDLLEYVFSSSQFKLTGKQSIGFSFVARLIFNTPGASVNKFFDLLEIQQNAFWSSDFARVLAGLDDGTQRFFQGDFFGEFSETKEQIKARLYMILRSPELSLMFNASVRKVDWFDCIQKRKIVLVNTGKEQLGSGASQIFGRYVIASVVAAIGGRTYVDQSEWHPTFLYIDEAQQFVDENKTQDMLTLVREYRLGITLAHQQMTGVPLNDNMRAAISTNTAIKYAAGVEAQDLYAISRDLRCEPEFIQSQKVTEDDVQFACFVRNHDYDKPFRSTALRGNIDREPKMSKADLDRSIAHNRKLVSAPIPKVDPVAFIPPIEPIKPEKVEPRPEPVDDDPFDL